MDIGISTFPTDYSMDIAPLAKLIEDMGFTSLFVPEHPILPVETSSPWPGSEDGVIPKVYAAIISLSLFSLMQVSNMLMKTMNGAIVTIVFGII